MTKSVRTYDALGRYGGEEFLIVAPNCTVAHAQALAERVRHMVEEHPFFAAGARLP